ncbi:hypothetical protein QIS74_03098 [Colletotrichum tabaci]|uniref:Uncharacterized protein n=1 Tax=Colletotrichum tabaci TaxID=1209068 RepID=A0AAV9TQ80_9PEZI
MSVILRVANVIKAEYKPEEGFAEVNGDGPPCINCLGRLHRDVNELTCCTGTHTARCLACVVDRKKCSAVPRELWGAAQKTWNTFTDYRIYDSNGELSPRERWRIVAALERLSAAWVKIAQYIADPSQGGLRGINIDQMTVQELASNREHLSLLALINAGILTDKDDIVKRLDQLQPAYLRDDSRAIALRSTLKFLIRDCYLVHRPGDRERDLEEFEEWPAFRNLLPTYVGNPVPTCAVAVAGSAPVARGAGTATPQKRTNNAQSASKKASASRKRRRSLSESPSAQASVRQRGRRAVPADRSPSPEEEEDSEPEEPIHSRAPTEDSEDSTPSPEPELPPRSPADGPPSPRPEAPQPSPEPGPAPPDSVRSASSRSASPDLLWDLRPISTAFFNTYSDEDMAEIREIRRRVDEVTAARAALRLDGINPTGRVPGVPRAERRRLREYEDRKEEAKAETVALGVVWYDPDDEDEGEDGGA